jgi:ribonuclease R
MKRPRRQKNQGGRRKREPIKFSRKREKMPRATGILSVSAGGFGFVALETGPDEDKQPDLFIPPRFVGQGMDGDKVEVELLPQDRYREPGHGAAARIVDIIEHGRTLIVGELLAGHKVRPINKKIRDDIQISGSLCGAKRGDWVNVELLHASGVELNGMRRGVIRGKVGRAGTIIGDLDAVCSEFSLPEPYSAEDNKEADEMEITPIKRRDLSNIFCVTIDPEDAKDYDDAVSIMPGEDENEVLVGVHIADVAAWIRPDTKWDTEAIYRSFTAYLPGRTLPMLPKSLTAKISLQPGEPCPAHTVMMTIHKISGRILKAERCHSYIKITKRLSFQQVQKYIDTGDKGDWDETFCNSMDELIALYKNMRQYRKKTDKFLEMAIPEIRVICNEETNEITGMVRKEQREADQLIEEFMLAANTEVAKEMVAKSIPGIYRVHPEPELEKLDEFGNFCIASFDMYPGDLSNRANCNKFLESIPDGPNKPIILSAFLRSLQRAYYLENSELHFGLGKGRYSHFTSPIRRYPDLAVHQQLWSADTNARLKSKKTMAKISAECTEKEQNNDEAWYAANDRMKLRYMEQQLEANPEEMHEGVVARITSAGMLADIPKMGVYGFIPLEQLNGRFKYDKTNEMLYSVRGHQEYHPGDVIFLRLAGIDFIKGSAIFQPF